MAAALPGVPGAPGDGETPGQLPVAAAETNWHQRACSPPVSWFRCWPGAGISLSASQVHRLVTGTPGRLSLPVLAALCDILDVTPRGLDRHQSPER